METMMGFENIAKKLSPTLMRIAHKLNGRFTFFDEDDLFQEALGHLWANFQDGTLNGKTDSYLLQGCYYHLKNYIRKSVDKAKLVSTSAPLDDGESKIEDILECKKDCAAEIVDSVMLEGALQSLGLSGREAMILSLLLEGMTVREVGRKIGVSHVMVIKVKARIRAKYARIKNFHL
jgi:RNA polymerase sigma factor (sigma-70 family)